MPRHSPPVRPAARRAALAAAAVLAAGACTREGAPRLSRAACGIAAFAGPTTLLDQFRVPGQTLGEPPRGLPPRLVARLAAGPAYPAVVGHTDSTVVVGVDGPLPAGSMVQMGVLVVDLAGVTRGMLLYELPPIERAPRIGTVDVAGRQVPLLGIQLDPLKVEDPRCPLFADSVLR